ncbi:hypothetical protein CWC25_12360 [Pseudoalteromonas sp. S4389]|uniref:GIY-YIG nuclease family protein n=1 Tax=Pseudoalteromonas sp. S4389 TaxID=579556 RepID=UPI0011096E5C|nr:GIY-YIG nuclease family protein [Pseudoalteromonas sp. S4389]TMO43424.1 hypothetical protein CWC25_12360 [Pseudoalteromonas sp. S4389]
MAGWVYVLENKSMPGLVKVGYTKHSPKSRAGQLYQTGIPTPFTIYYAGLFENPRLIEGKAHKTLKHCRVSRGREFFKCRPSEAVSAIEAHAKPASTKSEISKSEWANFYKAKKAVEKNCRAEISVIEVERKYLIEKLKDKKENIYLNAKKLTGGVTYGHFAGWFLPSILICDAFENEGFAFFIIWLLGSLTTSNHQINKIKKSNNYNNLVTNRLTSIKLEEVELNSTIDSQIALTKDKANQKIQTLKNNLNQP